MPRPVTRTAGRHCPTPAARWPAGRAVLPAPPAGESAYDDGRFGVHDPSPGRFSRSRTPRCWRRKGRCSRKVLEEGGPALPSQGPAKAAVSAAPRSRKAPPAASQRFRGALELEEGGRRLPARRQGLHVLGIIVDQARHREEGEVERRQGEAGEDERRALDAAPRLLQRAVDRRPRLGVGAEGRLQVRAPRLRAADRGGGDLQPEPVEGGVERPARAEEGELGLDPPRRPRRQRLPGQGRERLSGPEARRHEVGQGVDRRRGEPRRQAPLTAPLPALQSEIEPAPRTGERHRRAADPRDAVARERVPLPHRVPRDRAPPRGRRWRSPGAGSPDPAAGRTAPRPARRARRGWAAPARGGPRGAAAARSPPAAGSSATGAAAPLSLPPPAVALRPPVSGAAAPPAHRPRKPRGDQEQRRRRPAGGRRRRGRSSPRTWPSPPP